MYQVGRDDLEYILKSIRSIRARIDKLTNIVEKIVCSQGKETFSYNPDEYLERDYIDPTKK